MILIYALERGETERYTERLLSTQCRTAADVAAIVKRAESDGWHSFRVVEVSDIPERPDFAATVNRL